MHYYIDGYNIIFRVLHAQETLQLQREALIYDLSYKATLFNLNATLVFDSHYQEGERTQSHLDRLEIVYTAQGESADDYIIKAIKHGVNPKQLTVVTSDNRLAWKVRSFGGKTEAAEDFMDRLQRRFKNYLQAPEQPIEVEPPPSAVSSPSQETVRASLELPTLIQPPEKIRKPSKGKSQIPEKTSMPEECLNDYQDVFEKEYEALVSSFPTLIKTPMPEAEPLPPKASKKTKDKSGTIETQLSDQERWLQAFENHQDVSEDQDFELL